MVGFWTMVSFGALAIAASATSLLRKSSRASRFAKWSAAAAIVGAVLLAMAVPASFDARGDIPRWTDHLARAVGLGLQGLVTAGVALTARSTRRDAIEASAPFAAAIAIAIGGVALGQRVPLVGAVPLLGFVALRFAVLPLEARRRQDASSAARVCAWFVWTASILGLQARFFTRPGGILAMAVALAAGLAVVVGLQARQGRAIRATAVIPAVGLSFVLLFVFTLLMPSLAGSEYLFRIGVRPAAAIRPSGTVVDDGRYERWYSTRLDEATALKRVASSFRSPPVSVWPDFGTFVGLIFGYRIEVHYWAKGERPPPQVPCSTELHACVRMAVKRPVNF